MHDIIQLWQQIVLRTHRAPPQGVSICGKLFVELILHKVDKE